MACAQDILQAMHNAADWRSTYNNDSFMRSTHAAAAMEWNFATNQKSFIN